MSSPAPLRVRLTGRPVDPDEPLNGVDADRPTAEIGYARIQERPAAD